ncbi:MAG TPA: heat-inducible transcriptional repressor HrcA [Actinomycetota bacterium]
MRVLTSKFDMNNPTEPLGDRQGDILVAIVREYIRTADPVGSKHLVGKYNLAVSAATVRNEMARLEELGYLAHPHTSAGRVPTDRGYRFFVDQQRPAKLGSHGRAEIESAIGAEPADMDELMRRASDALSRATNLAAAALTPRLRTSRLKHLDLAWLGPRRAVVIAIADGGRVEKRIVEMEHDVSEAALESAGAELNHLLTGTTVDVAERAARERAGADTTPAADAAVAGAVASALEAFLDEDQEVVVGGASTLAGAFGDQDSFPRVFEVIERRIDLQPLMSDAQPPASIRIGTEVPVENLQMCSLIFAPYAHGAAVGVIGPTRMEYPQVIAAVSMMARLLNNAVQDLS